ncbi:hypothetical protein MTBLM5_10257 [Magnetospirillum sp. LM-5]|uniref:glycosyltransferase family protein n=1 Tax=Magnetospirillum sp. LM-5 TaxID=2681466 RepID=UPI00137FCB5A|nr:glycosyltransferase [Magnetospirillum sp. LM-5]CAA7611976.1 hypothetical protein MTBLM5_10257 [Magnetospirillum sp. LM-5]
MVDDEVLKRWRHDVQQAGGGPQAWLNLAGGLAGQGLLDGGAIPALQDGLAQLPGDGGLIKALALYEFRAGLDDVARARLAELAPLDAEAALLRLRIDQASGAIARDDMVRAAALVINVTPWGEPHEEFIRLCREADHHDLGVQLVSQWLQHRGANVWAYLRAGEMMLESGQVAASIPVLLDLWQQRYLVSADIGPWTGIPDDNPADEARVIEAISHAFATPESELPLHPLPDHGHDPARVSVLYVGSERTGAGLDAQNDLAAHFKAAALAAGGQCSVWLDSVLAAPWGRRCGDALAQARRHAFVAELDRTRPDIVLFDVQALPGGRSVSIDDMKDLKQRFGFRLVFVSRDTLRATHGLIEAWARVADKILLFDPNAYVFTDRNATDLGARSLAIPVPALGAPFAPIDAPAEHQLLFVGSTSGPHRSYLVAGLAAADIGLEAVIGRRRRQIAPDRESYARLLASSRAVVNVAAHAYGDGGSLVTGRVWETIGAGSLLFEQLYEGSSRFFAPWRHFVPWSEPADIIRRWRVLSRHEELRAKIAREAHDWAERHYGPDRVWQAILSHALA